MAAQVPFRRGPFLVFGDILPNVPLAPHREDWVMVKCGKRQAYGCGDKGQRIVDGLNLYMRAGPEDKPEFRPDMRIGATPDVLNLLGWEIDEKMAEIYGRSIRTSAIVQSVDGGVMALHISFVARHKGPDFRSYCLVYDSTSKALFLLPERPHGCLPLCPSAPLKVGQDKFSVVLMVEKRASDSSTYPVLCLWSPPPATGIKGKHRLNDDESDKCAWIDKCRVPQDADAIGFTPSRVFSYKGNAVWGDLGQGILYCDCGDLNVGPAPVDFKFNLLPLKCRAAFDLDQPPFPVYRNMGCVGDSIWFVIIQPPPSPDEQSPGETMVSVWTLDLLSEEWKPHREFKMQTIWDLDGFRAHSLPNTVPMFPIIRQQDDGILYVLLPEPSRRGGRYAHLLGIDLRSSCEEPRLMPPRRLVIPWLHRPVVLDPNFFGPRDIFERCYTRKGALAASIPVGSQGVA